MRIFADGLLQDLEVDDVPTATYRIPEVVKRLLDMPITELRALVQVEPPLTDSRAVDTILAAVVAYVCDQRDLPEPDWCSADTRTCPRPWPTMQIPRRRAPEAFTSRRIYLTAPTIGGRRR